VRDAIRALDSIIEVSEFVEKVKKHRLKPGE